MRGAQPVDRLAGGGDLGAAFAAEPGHELARCARQVVVHLPDVDLQAVAVGGGHALGHLVAVLGEGLAPRQDVAGVVRPAGPQHVGQDHVEAGRGQLLGRAVPIAGIGPGAGVVPEGPAFAGLAGLGPQVGLDQQAVRLAEFLYGGGELVAGQTVAGRTDGPRAAFPSRATAAALPLARTNAATASAAGR